LKSEEDRGLAGRNLVACPGASDQAFSAVFSTGGHARRSEYPPRIFGNALLYVSCYHFFQ